ncbi:MAG: cytochrome c oxidase assembly protein [Tetrasphaera sp.]
MTPFAPAGPPRRAVLSLAIPAVVAVAVFAILGKVVAAYTVGDPGVVMRWLGPLAGVGTMIGACGTVGFLLLGAFLAPETTRTHRRAAAARYAAGFAGLWLAGLLANQVAYFASASGFRPSQPQFWSQFFGLAWELQPSRMDIISAVVVAVMLATCVQTHTTTALAWCWFGALFALLPTALAGHSAVSRDHMSSINALAIHLLAVTTWVGGLLALVILRRGLGPHLPVAARRFSRAAAWSYAALGLSGILAAWFNLTAIGDLATAYGAMLLVKVGAFVLLGFAGYRNRTLALRTLDADPGSGSAFARLALGELLLMGVAIGTAVALARTPAPAIESIPADPTTVYALTGYGDPGAPPDHAWLVTWHADWLWIAVAAVAIGVYANWMHRLHQRGDRWPAWQLICWVAGWLVFVYSMCGAPGVYGRVLFSWHMIMHMTVAMLVPLLLVPAAPITLALRALPARHDKTRGPRELILALVHSRYLHVVANPVVAAVIFFFSLATFYFTPLFYYALATHTGHILMTVHFLLSGYLFTWVLVGTDPGPKRWPPLILLVVLFATISFHAFLGVIITSSNNLLAPDFFGQLGLPWMTDPLGDQHIGGAIAWGVGEAPTLVLALMVTWQWVRADRRETERLDRQADRDHDAELAAYNARLADIAAHDRREGASR